jgi:hypothetical protein
MSSEDIKKLIGKKGTIILSSLTVEVKVLDVKSAYGRTRFQVEPIAGSGKAWMEKVAISK